MTEVFKIFKTCFPHIGVTEEQFRGLFSGCEIIREEGKGAALVRDNTVRLLAVLPEYRGRGIGSELLRGCERLISDRGCGRVELSGSPLCGAVGDSVEFFAKRGYQKGHDYVEMGMDITNYAAPAFSLPDGVEFAFYRGTAEELRRAVAAVDDEWVQYFTDLSAVYCGYLGGELASFCIIGTDELCLLSDETARVGSVGCVGTLPRFRKKGIGLAMVSSATEYLRDNGSTTCFIHYTHLEGWYARLGYKTFLRFSPMSKAL